MVQTEGSFVDATATAHKKQPMDANVYRENNEEQIFIFSNHFPRRY